MPDAGDFEQIAVPDPGLEAHARHVVAHGLALLRIPVLDDVPRRIEAGVVISNPTQNADGVPWGRLPALPAFWVGLLYDDTSLDAAWDIVKHWNAQERQAMRDDVPRMRL